MHVTARFMHRRATLDRRAFMSHDNSIAKLFYDSIWDALGRTVHSNTKGYNIKQIGSRLWPSKEVENARATLSKAINPDNESVNLDPEELIKTMEITEAPEHIIYFLCDYFGFDRPPRKNKTAFETQIKEQFQDVVSQVTNIGKLIEKMQQCKSE